MYQQKHFVIENWTPQFLNEKDEHILFHTALVKDKRCSWHGPSNSPEDTLSHKYDCLGKSDTRFIQ